MMKLALVLIAVVVLIMLAVYVCFRITCVRGRTTDRTAETIKENSIFAPYREKIKAGRAFFNSQTPESLYITSFDGLKLHADLFKSSDESRKIMILMHGYRSSYFSDFGPSLEYYLKLGYNVLAVDERCHGKSEGRYISYGIFEKYDCRDWANEMFRRFKSDYKIYLGGISMGATTVLLASALDMPPNVAAIVADCGFSGGYDIVKNVARNISPLIPSAMVVAVNFLCRIFAGFDLRDDNTLVALKKCKIPVLFIHGTRDTLVPCEMSARNFAVLSAPKEILMVPGAAHGMSFLVNEPLYKQTLEEFLSKY